MPRLRTGYSFRTAAGTIEECLSRIQECEWPVAPITDRASTFGWVRWEAASKKAGLRPLFGVELGVVADVGEKKPTIDYWTFIAIDFVAPVNRLVALATQQFRYEPLITYAQAMAAEGVYKIVGHRAKLDLVSPSSTILYGLSSASAKGHVKRAIDLGLEMVATTNNFYPRKEDVGFYEVLCGRGASTQVYDQHIQTDEEWIASVSRALPDAEKQKAALTMRNDVWD